MGECKCNENHINGNAPVPYMAHEGQCVRYERIIKRLVIALIVAIYLMFATNALWLYAWTQYDYASAEIATTYTQDGQGLNIIGNSNEVNNGANFDGDSAETDTQEKERQLEGNED